MTVCHLEVDYSTYLQSARTGYTFWWELCAILGELSRSLCLAPPLTARVADFSLSD